MGKCYAFFFPFSKLKNFKYLQRAACFIKFDIMKKRENVSKTNANDNIRTYSLCRPLREKCPNAKLFLVRIFLYLDQK